MNRKLCICQICKQEKFHFGKNMCSACLRKFKRQNNPEFYLNTCYSELSRRVKNFDKIRPNYFGLNKCTKFEFINKFINDKNFIKQFELWKTNNFQRKYAPSIDRINNLGDYTLDNLQFISLSDNSNKDTKQKVVAYFDTNFIEFDSQKQCSLYLGISASFLCRLFKKSNTIVYNGVKLERI